MQNQNHLPGRVCGEPEERQCLEARLLHAIVSGAGLGEIVRLAAESLGNPVILIDAGYKLLACSEKDGIDDPLWEEILRQGYWSYDTVNRFKEDKIVEQVIASSGPVLIDWGVSAKTRRISTKVEAGGVVAGHLAVLEYAAPFSGGEIEQLALVGRVIGSELKKPEKAALASTMSGLAYERVIRDLLEGRLEDPEEAPARLRTAGWREPRWLYVLLIDLEAYDPSHSLAQVVRDTVARVLPGAQPVIFRNHIVVVLGGDEGWAPPPDALEKVVALVQKQRMRASVSQRFGSIVDVERYYSQAKSLLGIGARLGRDASFYPYEEYGVYLMIHRCNKQENVEHFCHPVLPALREYDFANHTEYFRSLHAYLMHARSLSAAADALFIHRNTMRYRLAKISELMAVDLEDDGFLSQLYMNYKILEYLGKM